MSKIFSLLLAGLIVSLAAPAEAGQVRYAGMHPVPAEDGGGFCEIDFPHVHVFEPQKPDILYRSHDHGYAFVGDPVPYGYQGPKHAFYGPHPIQDEGGDTEYCYLDGPHYHSLPPPPAVAASFKLKGGVYFYGGRFPTAYYEARPRYSRINVVYKPLEYPRPVVVAAPPEAEAQAVVAVSPPVISAGISVQAGIGAGLLVGAPPPPAVMVVERHGPRTIVVEDHRPRTIFVEDHRPRTVVVEDHRPRTVVVRDHDERVEVVRVKEHGHGHGHGKSGKGW